MEQINIHAAKTHLSALVEKAAAGEPFIIAKAGHPLVTVSKLNTSPVCQGWKRYINIAMYNGK